MLLKRGRSARKIIHLEKVFTDLVRENCNTYNRINLQTKVLSLPLDRPNALAIALNIVFANSWNEYSTREPEG